MVYTKINYLLHETCIICKYGSFPNGLWGSCIHLDEETRVCAAGRCSDWELNEKDLPAAFKEHMAGNTKEKRASKSMKKGLPSK